MSELKKGPYFNLLHKKPLKEIAARVSNKSISNSDLNNYLPANWLNFQLTFSYWGEKSKYHNINWVQTTRPGFSFVLQLNFDESHNAVYYKLIPPKDKEDPLFKYNCHPVAEKKYALTMAWARIDIDFNTNEVLIEEIQSDWFIEFDRIFKGISKEMVKHEREVINDCWINSYATTTYFNLKQYKTFLQPYKKVWAEAMLSATLDFSVYELGIRDVYMHTYQSGCILKNCSPPKSLYTKLPKRFGFELTSHAPKFIQTAEKIKKKIRKGNFTWWRLLL